MRSLPTLRRNFIKSFIAIVGIYSVLGVFLIFAVLLASRTTPRLLHLNYDSIVASRQIKDAWYGYADDAKFRWRTKQEWINQFDNALRFEEGNITEVGESEAVAAIRALWESTKKSGLPPDEHHFQDMIRSLDQVVKVNESSMFGLAEQNADLSRDVLFGAIVYLFITLILSAIFVNSMATRLARPLKSIAEVLEVTPDFTKHLRLPEPTSLEVYILTSKLNQLWEKLRETTQLNVKDLVQQKRKLETVLCSVEDALLVLDVFKNVSHCTELFSKIIGLKTEQILGQKWKDLSSMSENYLKLRDSLNPDMVDIREVELWVNHSKRIFSVRSKKIEGPGGNLIGVLYLLHDMTEKRQRDRLRNEFIDLLSHELKTPLQSLGTASELLSAQKDQFSPDMVLLIDTISEDIDRIRAVANEFVQITQSQDKILRLHFDQVPINSRIRDWIKPFYVVARDRRVKIDCVQKGSDTIWANVDPVKFPWVISNLLANAVRFSPKGGTVQVSITDTQQLVEITVSDEGPGVSIGDRKKIFDPFFQSRTPAVQGNRGLFGLGLTIAKEVVEAHEGKIEYLPRNPKGSTFRITLPNPNQK